MPSLNDHPMFEVEKVLSDDAVLTDDSETLPRDDAGLPLDTDCWVCTCGHENEGTDRCEACDEFLHGRDWYWDSFRS